MNASITLFGVSFVSGGEDVALLFSVLVMEVVMVVLLVLLGTLVWPRVGCCSDSLPNFKRALPETRG